MPTMPSVTSPTVTGGGAPGEVTESSQTPAPWRPRLLVAAGLVLVAVNLRPAVTAVSPLLQDAQRDLGMSATAAGLLGTAPTLAFAVFGALAPWAARRVGLERIAWIAMLLAAAGQVLRALAPETVSFLACSVLALGGMGIANVVLPPLVKRYFPDRVGTMTGAYVLLLAFGTALPPLFAVPVGQASHWRVAVGSWALLAAVAAVPWVLAARRAAARARSAGASMADPHLPATALLRSPVAWGLAALLGMTSLNTYAMFAWLPALLVDGGLTAGAAGGMLSLFAAVGMPLSLFVPWAAARMRNPFPLVVAFLACYAVGYTGLLLAPGAATAVWVVAAGLGPGAFPMSLALVNLRSATTEGSAALSGFAQGVGYTVAGAGPLVVGWLRDVTGGWTLGLAFLAATLVVQVAGAAVICRPRMVEDDVRPGRTERLRAATTLER
jgi:CP family cyanate transporter-like MFS transporter